jgi:cytoplasmic iron level regulating protein YaaA (DUF328/UPF0246 family)
MTIRFHTYCDAKSLIWRQLEADQKDGHLEQLGSNTLINLASGEYFKVVDNKLLKAKIINIDFKDQRENGQYATVSIFAKQARGSMCRFVF